MNKTVTADVPGELADWLDQTARESQWSRDYLLSVILAAARAKYSGENAFAKHSGAVKGTPADLSAQKGFDRGGQ